MRAVWSFWTVPHRIHRRWHWASEKHHLFSWLLSVELARRHYPDTALYTDDDGARLLIDGLRLPFVHVSTTLNALADEDPDWWMLGKLHTYHAQIEPFLHIDYDVYLWNPLPERLTAAQLFAQNPEAVAGAPWYDVDLCEFVIRAEGDGYVPVEWQRYRESPTDQQAACCGIVGGNETGFVRYYAAIAIRLLQSPRNRAAFEMLPDKKLYNPLFEQYVLCACAAYHGIPIEYLFPSCGALDQADEAGYTHLIAAAKSNPGIARRLEQRIAREFPESYERCLRLVGEL